MIYVRHLPLFNYLANMRTVGGPDRPIPEESKPDNPSMNLPSVAGVMEAATAAQNSLYDRLGSVLDQRG